MTASSSETSRTIIKRRFAIGFEVCQLNFVNARVPSKASFRRPPVDPVAHHGHLVVFSFASLNMPVPTLTQASRAFK